jgi:hydroxyacylglutathione hydrolase
MYLQQFFLEGLGHASYLVGDPAAGVGVVVDPRRDVDVYLTAALAAGLAVRHVLETHTHNDYVSGARALAALTGAELWASDAGDGAGLQCDHRRLKEGGEVRAGRVRLRALETPGHTPEHLAFAVFDGDGDTPDVVFSGGALLVGGAGRPDLSGAARSAPLARAQYESVRRLLALPEGVQVFPTHGGGSFCGGGNGTARWSTVGTERRTNRLARFVAAGDAAGFAAAVLHDLPVVPAYWARMRPLNTIGAPPLAAIGGVAGLPGLLVPRPLGPGAVHDLLAREAVYVVDARDAAGFGGAHAPGAFGIGLGPSFGVWVGSVVPPDRPLVLVLPDDEGAAPAGPAGAWETAVRQLLRVGYDAVAGYLAGGMRAWAGAGLPFEQIEQVSASWAAARLSRGDLLLLDVRQPAEWAAGHAPGALHVPGAALPARLERPEAATAPERLRPWAVICSTGYRSSVGASVLRRHGVREVVNVLGGMNAWTAAGLPVEAATVAGAGAMAGRRRPGRSPGTSGAPG